MIDTHAHIDTEAFDSDRNEVLENAFNSGVNYIIIPAVEEKDFNKILDISSKYERVYCGIGIHPHSALSFNDRSISTIENSCKDPKVIAIGEIGLDYYYDFAPKELQKTVFRRQILIAKEQKLPVIVHNRESDEDIINIIQDEQDGNLEGVLHCFSGPVELMNQALDLNFHISFTGNITFKKINLEDVIINAPLDRIMLETDSPYMTPVPFRGKRNEPSHIGLIAEKIAEYKSISFDEVITMTTKNAKKLFKLTIIILFFYLGFLTAYSQDNSVDEDYEGMFTEETVNPYHKTLGACLNIGTNYIIQTYYLKEGEKDVTFEGILFLGGALSYSPIDFLIIQGGYFYSKNTKIAEDSKFLLGPNIYNVVELNFQFLINPSNRISFFGSIGPTLLLNTYDQGGKRERSSQQFGINGGLGFYINIPISGAGLFNIAAEWRLNFDLSRAESAYLISIDPKNPENNVYEIVNTNSFYSMPRIGIIWYPF